MRAAAVLGFIAVAAVAFATFPAGAAPLAAGKTGSGTAPAIEKVAEGCGPGWHWVGGYRNRWGNWVRGHCVPN